MAGKPSLRAMTTSVLRVSEEVKAALAEQRPVVALESTIISHGMPAPDNVAMALEVEGIIRAGGAVPATVAVIDGQLCVGITKAEVERLGDPNASVSKVSRRDLPMLLASGKLGATTVSGTMIGAHMAGIRVFVTGGIGGVHRGVEDTMDVSADLTELGRTPVGVVCAGAKSILDIPRTLEYLETQGVAVMTLASPAQQASSVEFPAFYSPRSGSLSPAVAGPADAIQDAAKALYAIDKLAHSSMAAPWSSGAVIGVPIDFRHPGDAPASDPPPSEQELATLESAVATAIERSRTEGYSGRDLTPFLLRTVKELTQGLSQRVNVDLVRNNARAGVRIAAELSRLQRTPSAAIGGAAGRRGFSTSARLGEAAPESKRPDLASVTPETVAFSKIAPPGSVHGPSLATPPVVAFGGVLADVIARAASGDGSLGHEHAATGLARGTSVPGSTTIQAGGVARNVAAAVASCGTQTSIVCPTGDDGFGQAIRADMTRRGLQLLPSSPFPNAHTATFTALTSAQGNDMVYAVADTSIMDAFDPHFAQAVIDHSSAAPSREPMTEGSGLLDGAAAVVLDTNLAPDTLHAVAAAARRARPARHTADGHWAVAPPRERLVELGEEAQADAMEAAARRRDEAGAALVEGADEHRASAYTQMAKRDAFKGMMARSDLADHEASEEELGAPAAILGSWASSGVPVWLEPTSVPKAPRSASRELLGQVAVLAPNVQELLAIWKATGVGRVRSAEPVAEAAPEADLAAAFSPDAKLADMEAALRGPSEVEAAPAPSGWGDESQAASAAAASGSARSGAGPAAALSASSASATTAGGDGGSTPEAFGAPASVAEAKARFEEAERTSGAVVEDGDFPAGLPLPLQAGGEAVLMSERAFAELDLQTVDWEHPEMAELAAFSELSAEQFRNSMEMAQLEARRKLDVTAIRDEAPVAGEAQTSTDAASGAGSSKPGAGGSSRQFSSSAHASSSSGSGGNDSGVKVFASSEEAWAAAFDEEQEEGEEEARPTRPMPRVESQRTRGSGHNSKRTPGAGRHQATAEDGDDGDDGDADDPFPRGAGPPEPTVEQLEREAKAAFDQAQASAGRTEEVEDMKSQLQQHEQSLLQAIPGAAFMAAKDVLAYMCDPAAVTDASSGRSAGLVHGQKHVLVSAGAAGLLWVRKPPCQSPAEAQAMAEDNDHLHGSIRHGYDFTHFRVPGLTADHAAGGTTGAGDTLCGATCHAASSLGLTMHFAILFGLAATRVKLRTAEAVPLSILAPEADARTVARFAEGGRSGSGAVCWRQAWDVATAAFEGATDEVDGDGGDDDEEEDGEGAGELVEGSEWWSDLADHLAPSGRTPGDDVAIEPEVASMEGAELSERLGSALDRPDNLPGSLANAAEQRRQDTPGPLREANTKRLERLAAVLPLLSAEMRQELAAVCAINPHDFMSTDMLSVVVAYDDYLEWVAASQPQLAALASGQLAGARAEMRRVVEEMYRVAMLPGRQQDA